MSTFCAGTRSTQITESLNNDLKDYFKPCLDVSQFLKHLEGIIDDKLYKEQ